MGLSPALRPHEEYSCCREGYPGGISLFLRQTEKWFRPRAICFAAARSRYVRHSRDTILDRNTFFLDRPQVILLLDSAREQEGTNFFRCAVVVVVVMSSVRQ